MFKNPPEILAWTADNLSLGLTDGRNGGFPPPRVPLPRRNHE